MILKAALLGRFLFFVGKYYIITECHNFLLLYIYKFEN